MSLQRLYLRRDVYACPTDYHWMLLDLQTDRYLAIPRRRCQVLEDLIRGRDPQLQSLPGGDALTSDLLKNGLVTENPAEGHAPARGTLPTASQTLDPRKRCFDWRSCLSSLPTFLIACALSDYRLRHWPLIRSVSFVRQRRTAKQRSNAAFDWATAQLWTLIFNTLRPLYPRNYLCLFDSLALIEFLARSRLYPKWVFGVITDPFHAHCWVQQDCVLLNDTVERTAIYQPILMV